MEIEIHAPSHLVLAVSLALAVLALICYLIATPTTLGFAFWIALLAYVVAAGGAILKTS
ncbi:MAG TPA: hypothetical protein VE801_16710 [Xanthobacteraceae bacterium]|jgi:hypothetical protein|nr:hypothetical protein [Xanthobacteraceae bacterium]